MVGPESVSTHGGGRTAADERFGTKWQSNSDVWPVVRSTRTPVTAHWTPLSRTLRPRWYLRPMATSSHWDSDQGCAPHGPVFFLFSETTSPVTCTQRFHTFLEVPGTAPNFANFSRMPETTLHSNPIGSHRTHFVVGEPPTHGTTPFFWNTPCNALTSFTCLGHTLAGHHGCRSSHTLWAHIPTRDAPIWDSSEVGRNLGSPSRDQLGAQLGRAVRVQTHVCPSSSCRIHHSWRIQHIRAVHHRVLLVRFRMRDPQCHDDDPQSHGVTALCPCFPGLGPIVDLLHLWWAPPLCLQGLWTSLSPLRQTKQCAAPLLLSVPSVGLWARKALRTRLPSFTCHPEPRNFQRSLNVDVCRATVMCGCSGKQACPQM